MRNSLKNIKNLSLLLFTICFSFNALAQDFSLQKAIDNAEKEVQKQYEILLSLSKPNTKQLIINSQNAYIQYIKLENELNLKYYYRNEKITPYSRSITFFKRREKELIYLINQIKTTEYKSKRNEDLWIEDRKRLSKIAPTNALFNVRNTYQTLLSYTNDSRKDLLIKSQNTWEIYREEQLLLYAIVFNENVMENYKKHYAEIHRKRMSDLNDHL